MSWIRLATTSVEIARCFPVMHQLRPHLKPEEFVARVQIQHAQGYHLAYLEDQGEIVALGGFRIHDLLASGKTLYVDDLVTDEARRSQGFGHLMLAWLEAHARALGCQTFSLDSGTQRREAHAFYFREHMRITSFHFAKDL